MGHKASNPDTNCQEETMKNEKTEIAAKKTIDEQVADVAAAPKKMKKEKLAEDTPAAAKKVKKTNRVKPEKKLAELKDAKSTKEVKSKAPKEDKPKALKEDKLTKFLVSMKKSVRKNLKKEAADVGVSMNEYIVSAVEEKLNRS
jgi:hypothetical protein